MNIKVKRAPYEKKSPYKVVFNAKIERYILRHFKPMKKLLRPVKGRMFQRTSIETSLQMHQLRALILDGGKLRTTKMLISLGLTPKNICSIECVKKVHNIHKQYGINSCFGDLKELAYISQKHGPSPNNTKYNLMLLDINNAITYGKYITILAQNWLTNNGVLVVTFSKRVPIAGANFADELAAWERATFGKIVPSTAQNCYEYSDVKHGQSAMCSKFYVWHSAAENTELLLDCDDLNAIYNYDAHTMFEADMDVLKQKELELLCETRKQKWGEVVKSCKITNKHLWEINKGGIEDTLKILFTDEQIEVMYSHDFCAHEMWQKNERKVYLMAEMRKLMTRLKREIIG